MSEFKVVRGPDSDMERLIKKLDMLEIIVFFILVILLFIAVCK